eukprot:8454145-Pyramimonas_sp.AAC.1
MSRRPTPFGRRGLLPSTSSAGIISKRMSTIVSGPLGASFNTFGHPTQTASNTDHPPPTSQAPRGPKDGH